MYVKWQWPTDRKRQTSRSWYMRDTAHAYASLVENTRIDGKPKQRHVAYLGSVYVERNSQRAKDVHYRAWFWHHMRARLDGLGNQIGADGAKVEAQLAAKVPPVTADEVTAWDLACQHEIRVEYGECRGCYLGWPPGQEGVPPRPAWVDEPPDFAKVLAAVAGGHPHSGLP